MVYPIISKSRTYGAQSVYSIQGVLVPEVSNTSESEVPQVPKKRRYWVCSKWLKLKFYAPHIFVAKPPLCVCTLLLFGLGFLYLFDKFVRKVGVHSIESARPRGFWRGWLKS